MALGHLGAIGLRAVNGNELKSFSLVGLDVAVFFTICAYAGFVFRRLRVEREKIQPLRR